MTGVAGPARVAPVRTLFLTDGGQDSTAVAEFIAAFVGGARASLDLAIYDLRLAAAPAEVLLEAVAGVRRRGVLVRLLFNQDHARREPDPRPSEIDWDFLHRLDVPFQPVNGVPDLMHHKYVVRDAGTPEAAVLTGSSNWTNDSWTREENVLVEVPSADLAAWYHQDFEQLWEHPVVADSGRLTVPWLPLPGGGEVRAFFSPGRGPKLAHEIAHRLGAARRRIRILSPVITSGPILGTLAEVVELRPGIVAGAYDLTQMEEVQRQWGAEARAEWKLRAFDTVDRSVAFGRKRSTPWQSGGVHDFMHAKVVVADDIVFTGSYNLSHSGEENAENVLEVEHPALADRFAEFVDGVSARYGGRPAAE